MESEELEDLIKNPDQPGDRNLVYRNFSLLKENASDLLILLKHITPKVRAETLRMIGYQPPETVFETVFPEVLNALTDKEAIVRQQAAETLLLLYANFESYDADAVIPDLIPLLEDPSAMTRMQVVKTLIALGYNAALSHLVPLLRDPDKEVRRKVIMNNLSRICKVALTDLIAMLEDENEDAIVRSFILVALHHFDEEASLETVFPKVINCLKDESAEVRRQAADTLRMFSWQFQSLNRDEIILLLLPLLEDESPATQAQAAHTLVSLGYDAPLPQLVALLIHPDDGARTFALRGIRYLGPKEAIPNLLVMLQQEENPYNLLKIIEVLRLLKAKEAVPSLIKFLTYGLPDNYSRSLSHVHPNIPAGLTLRIREVALTELKAINDPQTVESVKPLLSHSDEQVQKAARDLLEHFSVQS